ncbi:MED6-domain-containing protein [Pisolithus croceorrhizus]|nr:MED6-domain-containing protein [Pisolithus croceorrhizus]KAI6134082.1 MED6-domain-containing protein [Pisolithus croceorrhizus]
MEFNDLHPTDDYSHRFFIWHEWIQANGPLTTENVFDYFAASMFYDKQSNNQNLRMQNTGVPLLNESDGLKQLTGIEFALVHAHPPSLFIIHKRERLSPHEVRPLAAYFVINNRIYQSPDVYTLLSNRLVFSFHFTMSGVSGLTSVVQLASLNSLRSSLDTLRRYRPNYTPRTGFVWPIVDISAAENVSKKSSGEEMLSGTRETGESTPSQLDKQRTGNAGTNVTKKQEYNMLMFNAMQTTASHSTPTFTAQRSLVSDVESNPPESVVAGTSRRTSVTPAPVGRGTTPRGSSSGASTPQDTTGAKISAGVGKKKKKRTRTTPSLIDMAMTSG